MNSQISSVSKSFFSQGLTLELAFTFRQSALFVQFLQQRLVSGNEQAGGLRVAVQNM